MKRYFFLIALCMSLILTQAAYARDYIIVLSPVHFDHELKAQNKDVLRFLVSQVKPGEKATIIDGWHLKTIAEFTVKDDPKYDHPKIKIRSNPHVLRALNAFADNGLRDRLHAGVQIPQLYQYLGQNFAPFTDTTIIMLASPLYQDQHNLSWGIMNNMYPGDGHLNAANEVSQFSVVGRGDLLKNATIHWGHPYEWQSDDMYTLKVTRFHHLFAEGYGAKIATFTGDMTSLWRCIAENAASVPHGFTRDKTEKLETIEIVDPPQSEDRISIYERDLETGMKVLKLTFCTRVIMTYQTIDLTWRYIPFTLAYNRHYCALSGMAHVTIHCEEALPLTETGYRSIFTPAGTVPEDIVELSDMILSEMDWLSLQSDWQDQRQMSLF